MAKKPITKDFIVGIDIGTSKIATLVAEVDPNASMVEVVGIGSCPAHGLKKGVVVNIEQTVKSIQQSVAAAEAMIGQDITAVYTGIAGSNIRGFNSHGMLAIKAQEVTQEDVDLVLEAAQAIAIPADQKIIHVLPQDFSIDNQDAICDPLGMNGVRLEARVHIVTGMLGSINNVVNCLHRCGLTASDVVLEHFASSQAILTEDEQELGVCMVDIGGGTTDIAIFTRGSIRHTTVIPIAGDQVTNDLAIALRIATGQAERIKLEYGSDLWSDADDSIHAAPERDYNDQPELIARVIEARYEELLDLIGLEIKNSGFFERIPSGLVLTGGAAKLYGLADMAERRLGLPVRIGVPQNVAGLTAVVSDPIYATSAGLLLYGVKHRNKMQDQIVYNNELSVWGKMKRWLQMNF